MEKEEKKKRILQNVGIVALSIVIIGLLALCIYMFFIKKDDNNLTINYSKIDATKGTYYVVKGNTYDLYSHFENKYEKHDEEISFDYPVININTESVKKLNSDIKTMYDNLLKEIKASQDGCTCVKIDDKYYSGDGDHIPEYSYSIYETKDFITLKINMTLHSNCASGYSSDYLYTVSKRTGEVLNDKDIIDSLGYNRDKINKELPTYIQSLYHEDISSELENITNYLSFFPYDGKLVIGYEIIDGTEYVLYDGKNFKEVDYSIFNSIFKK